MILKDKNRRKMQHLERNSETKPEWNQEWEGVYIVQAGKCCKVGKAQDINERMRTIQTYNSMLCILVNYWIVPNPYAVECALQIQFDKRLVRGEWYKLPEPLIEQLRNVENITEWLASQKKSG